MSREETRGEGGGAAQASPLPITAPAATATGASPSPTVRIEDFTDEPLPPGGLEQLHTRPYDPAPERERVRTWTAFLLVGTLLITILLSFGTIWLGSAKSELTDLLTLIYAPLIGLVGAVAGFYYGTKERS